MPLIISKSAYSNSYRSGNTMKNSTRQVLCSALLTAGCMPALATAAICEWFPAGGPTSMNYQRNVGTLYVPRDARVGTVIGSVDSNNSTPNNAGLTARCLNDGTDIMFNARATAPIFPGPLDPINGEDVTGKILQTNIPGIGVRIKLAAPLGPTLSGNQPENAFVPIGPPTVPYDGYNNKNMLVHLSLNSLPNRITLVKTGPLPTTPQTLDGSELFSGHFPDLGRVFGYGIIGTIIPAQCSVGADAVSANPVELGNWDTADFTGPKYTTTPVSFKIRLSQCETDPGAGFVATANIRLDGILGSVPIGPTTDGVFSLTSDSDAKGMGIQVLKDDGTPIELATEVPMIPISQGVTQLALSARFYQTEPAAAVRPGLAKGALNFTLTYK